jgi:gas vesicle protein
MTTKKAAADAAAHEEDDVTHEDHRTRTFLAGLAIGALVGAGVALLFAPQSGEETRHAVARKAKHLAREARDRYDDVKDKLRRARRDHGRTGDDDEPSDA